jgi:putative tryptophan/tyrosine transport system substrate-binding protein
MIGRRDLFLLAGSAAAAWPKRGWAQKGERLKHVNVLMGTTDEPAQKGRVAAFRQGLEDLNWIDGGNIQFQVRWGAGDPGLIRAHVFQTMELAPDVILGGNTPVVRALKQATQAIPIVFAGLADPIGDGIVTSLSRPGGNITGIASFNGPIAGLWLQNLKEVAPGTKRVTVAYNAETAPHALFWPALDATAPSLGMQISRADVRDVPDIERAIAAVAHETGGGLLLLPDVFTARHRALIISLSAKYRIPAIWPLREWVREGALMSYGPDFIDQFRRAASYVDRILRGAKPADLAVQQPTKFEMAINLKTAKALGLTVPPLLLAQADEVIE